MVIWTRLCPEPTALDYGLDPVDVPVVWEVSLASNFITAFATGTFVTTPEWGHSVHVAVNGLADDTEYYYRFKCFGYTSRVGRFRTLPASGSSPQEIKFVLAGCQHYEFGFFTAWRRVAQESDIHLILFNGDWIYEGASQNVGVNGRCRTYPVPVPNCGTSLAEFRRRYALVGLDPDLITACQQSAMVIRPDDHEVQNNISSDPSYLDEKVAGYQAFYENMPVRRRGYVANSGFIVNYEDFVYGDLLEIVSLDARQLKSPLPCPELFDSCLTMNDPLRTMLGSTQEAWLNQKIQATTAKYLLLSQGSFVNRVDFRAVHDSLEERLYMDAWDGSQAARERLIVQLQRPDINPVILSGDFHKGMAMDLPSLTVDPESAPIAGEILCPAISSGGDGGTMSYAPDVLADNPHILSFFNKRGYVLGTATPQSLRFDFKTLDYVSTAGAPVTIRETFWVLPGQRGLSV
jgi:alkaline phosphatase D